LELPLADRRESGRRRDPPCARVADCIERRRIGRERTMSDSRLTPDVSERDHVDGPSDAHATLVEFGDYECPYCGMAYPIVKELQQRFVGQLRFAFRNFPLSESHPHAEHAAESAEAVADLGGSASFWAM